MNIIFKYDGAFPVILERVTGKPSKPYCVHYGLQTFHGGYDACAREIGLSIMHSLQCEGKLSEDDHG